MNNEESFLPSDKITLTNVEPSRFCEVWPTVKQGLQLLESMVTSKFIKGLISAVISAGDVVSSQVCK